MSISVTQKKRGRPATGHDPTITVRLPREVVSRFVSWASTRGMSRSQASTSNGCVRAGRTAVLFLLTSPAAGCGPRGWSTGGSQPARPLNPVRPKRIRGRLLDAGVVGHPKMRDRRGIDARTFARSTVRSAALRCVGLADSASCFRNEEKPQSTYGMRRFPLETTSSSVVGSSSNEWIYK